MSSGKMNFVNVTCLSFIIIFNLICNIFAMIFIFTKKKTNRTFKDEIVAALCSVNLAQALCYCTELSSAIQGSVLSHIQCELQAFVICSLTYASIYYFIVLAVERFTSIKKPTKHTIWFKSRRRRIGYIILPLFIGVLIGIGPLFGWSAYGKARLASTYCGFDFKKRGWGTIFYFVTVIVLAFLIPVMITGACFGYILNELHRRRLSNIKEFGRNSIISVSSSRLFRGQSLSLVLITTVYFVSWIPYVLVCCRFYFESPVDQTVEYIAIYMAKSATVSSPIIYCIIEKPFRVFSQETLPSYPLLSRIGSKKVG